MATLLHLDSSARTGISGTDPYGSHTRRLSARFVKNWLDKNPTGKVIYRDVGVTPPSHITGKWVHAAFTPAAARELWMNEVLAESDLLIHELLEADLIIAGVPMYNFGPPAQFKAYIDNIVRVGMTFGFDRTRSGAPYWPLLSQLGKQLVLLSSRGDFGYDADGHMAASNHVESSVFTAFAYIGITQTWQIAVEYDEFAGDRLAQSILHAEIEVDRLVAQMAGQ
ncbi:FMN-dependent NADH-azoreductase [Deefgea rivuli]|uniref:FMN-dependent NADH-azoreductase n=1 Tax=Deefgea rivuli TaxID=400948 RepID=UPI00047F5B9E|nr:NAD(P)H-dependent oxidoreductase [Deefgea rivuli]